MLHDAGQETPLNRGEPLALGLVWGRPRIPHLDGLPEVREQVSLLRPTVRRVA